MIQYDAMQKHLAVVSRRQEGAILGLTDIMAPLAGHGESIAYPRCGTTR